MTDDQSQTIDRAESIRADTIAILADLAAKSDQFELAASPEALGALHTKLVDNTYRVLVVGEAKRGKSSFVNALIGSDVLPTDVEVATSQVFRIAHAEQETYRLRFEDDSEQDISAADLAVYGSQVVADQAGAPKLDQTVRWIEVNLPARFIPKGVSLLDTPGLGALYAAHAQITYRFVPHADAVIFVLDSGQPILQAEIEFVETLLQVTRNIFFIQTKIDQYSPEDWQAIQQRNEEVLRDKFGKGLPDIRVWPVSNEGLKRAADVPREADREVYLRTSRYNELATALRIFLLRLVGCSRSAEALVLAEQYYASSRQALSGRLEVLSEESKLKQTELQERARANMNQFQADWGEKGFQRRELESAIKRTVDIAKQSFRQFVQSGGELAKEYEARIAALANIKQAEEMAKTLGEQVTAAAMHKWTSVCELSQRQCIESLVPFSNAAEGISTPLDAKGPEIHATTLTFQSLDALWERFKSGTRETYPAGVLAGVIAVVFNPYLAAVPLLGALYYGWISASGKQIKGAQDELKKGMHEILHNLRAYFFNVDQTSSRFSRVDEHFRALETAVLDQVQTVAKQKLEEGRIETLRLAEEAKLEGADKLAAAEKVKEQITCLDNTGKSIRRVGAMLKALEQSIAVAPQPTDDSAGTAKR